MIYSYLRNYKVPIKLMLDNSSKESGNLEGKATTLVNKAIVYLITLILNIACYLIFFYIVYTDYR